MAVTQIALFHDPATGLSGYVIPDDDAQLGDPAFNPKGGTHIRVSFADFQAGQQRGTLAADLVALLPSLTPTTKTDPQPSSPPLLPADWIALSRNLDSGPALDPYRAQLAKLDPNTAVTPDQAAATLAQSVNAAADAAAPS